MRDNLHIESAYRYDPDTERELDTRGVIIALLCSSLFWVAVGYVLWSRL